MLSLFGSIVVLSKIGQIIFRSLQVIRWKSENPNLQKVAKFCEGAYNNPFRGFFPPSIFIARKKSVGQYPIICEPGKEEIFCIKLKGKELKKIENRWVCGV